MCFWSQWLSGPHLMDSLINNASQIFWQMNPASMSLHIFFSYYLNVTPIFPHWTQRTMMAIVQKKNLIMLPARSPPTWKKVLILISADVAFVNDWTGSIDKVSLIPYIPDSVLIGLKWLTQ